MTVKVDLVLDCADAEALARFWAEALRGVRLGADGQYLVVGAPDGSHPRLILQQVAEPKTGKNRMHFDLKVLELGPEVERVRSLGARQVSEVIDECDCRWVVFNDPEGNEFCVCEEPRPPSP